MKVTRNSTLHQIDMEFCQCHNQMLTYGDTQKKRNLEYDFRLEITCSYIKGYRYEEVSREELSIIY